MLFQDGALADSGPQLLNHSPESCPHHSPRAKSYIWILLIGGLSHMWSIDSKPTLTKYTGKTFEETPFAKEILDEKKISEKLLNPKEQDREIFKQVMPLQTEYGYYGARLDRFIGFGQALSCVLLEIQLYQVASEKFDDAKPSVATNSHNPEIVLPLK